eukprot:m.257557 g.257557  ORF g.257557 m.257557 type:complete len:819 (+) comp15530_c1_seq3:147-2603(+)
MESEGDSSSSNDAYVSRTPYIDHAVDTYYAAQGISRLQQLEDRLNRLVVGVDSPGESVDSILARINLDMLDSDLESGGGRGSGDDGTGDDEAASDPEEKAEEEGGREGADACAGAVQGGLRDEGQGAHGVGLSGIPRPATGGATEMRKRFDAKKGAQSSTQGADEDDRVALDTFRELVCQHTQHHGDGDRDSGGMRKEDAAIEYTQYNSRAHDQGMVQKRTLSDHTADPAIEAKDRLMSFIQLQVNEKEAQQHRVSALRRQLQTLSEKFQEQVDLNNYLKAQLHRERLEHQQQQSIHSSEQGATQSKLHQSDTALQVLKARAEQLQTQLDAESQLRRTQTVAIERLQEKVESAAQQRIAIAEDFQQQFNEAKAKLKSKLKEETSRSSKLAHAYELQRMKLADSKRLIAEQEKLTQHLQAQLTQQSKQLEGHIQEAEAKHREDRDRLLELLQNQVDECASLDAQVNAFEKDREQAAATITQLTDHVQTLQAQLHEVANTNSVLHNRALKAERSVESYEKTVQTERAKYQSLLTRFNEQRAKASAQQSVIVGLREERKLWSQELAQQGASLSSQHGRLEVEVESLRSQLESAKEEVGKHKDSIAIKAKIVEDAQQTISDLKKKISDLESDGRSHREDTSHRITDLQDRLEAEKSLSTELQQELESLTDKYSLLKDEHATTKRAFDTAKHENSRLVHKWEDAGTKLQELETELEEMRKANETRALTAEAARDEALAQVEQLEQKIERIKASHSFELQGAIDQHNRVVATLAETTEQLSEMQHRLEQQEAIISQLRDEAAKAKQEQQQKISRLQRVLAEIQA